MSGIISLFLLMVVFSNCADNSELKFAERQQFKNVLMDVTLANSAIESYPLELRDSLREEYYDQVFEIHDITREEYEKFIRRIEKNPTQAKKIYSQILDSLKGVKNNRIENRENLSDNNN